MKLTKTFQKLAGLFFVLLAFSCNSQYDNTVYEAEFNKMPGNVSNLQQTVDYENQTITLTWDIKSASNAEKIVLTAWTDESCRSMNTNAGNLSQQKRIPLQESYTIRNLTLSKDYFFSVQTESKTGKTSAKQMISYSPIEHNSLVTYKLNETAYDFGYQKTEKVADIIYISDYEQPLSITPASVSIEMVSDSSTGRYELISIDKNTVNRGEKVTIRVKYIPGTYNGNAASASWDEAYLYISDSISPKPYLKLLASNFPQPNNIGLDDNGTHLKLWLRPELLSKNDYEEGTDSDEGVKFVKKLPDYSGYNFYATPESPEKAFLPTYQENAFGNMPAIFFDTKIKRLTSSGDIVSNLYGGSTAFVIFKRGIPSVSAETSYLNANILSAGNVSDYTYPNIEIRYASYDPSGKIGYGSTATNTKIDGKTYRELSCYRVPSLTVSSMSFLKGSNRFIFKPDSETNADEKRVPLNIPQNQAYSVCSIFDKDKITQDGSANLYTYVNGKKMLVSYTYLRESAPTVDDNDKLGTYAYASGNPWGDGKGNLNKFFLSANDSYAKTMEFTENIPYDSETAKKVYFEYMLNPTKLSEKGLANGDFAVRWWYNWHVTGADKSDYTEYFSNDIAKNSENYIYRAGVIKSIYLGSKPSLTSNDVYSYSSNYDPYIYISDVIIYDKPLSAEEIKTVNNYIKYRFGIGD